MQRCIHLYISGEQCEREAFPGGDFCEDHADTHMVDSEELTDHPVRKLFMRFAALLLLAVFLIPVYYTLRALYSAVQIEVEGDG